MTWIQKRYAVGTPLLFCWGAPPRWQPVTVARRFEIRSITGAMLGYKYLVRHPIGGKYSLSNAIYDFEIQES